jgi:hypothetical protein
MGKTGPKASIIGKPKQKDNSLSPGPGRYYNDHSVIKPKTPNVRIGSAERKTIIGELCKKKGALPGPGAYN